MSLQSRLFRKMWTKNDARRDAGLTVPEDIVTDCDLCYGTDRKWHLLDIYRPENAAGKLPVLVNFHGGGWFYGTKETYRYYCMELARQGFAVVNPSYRLAPENRFPAPFEDINSVFEYVLRHAEEYGFDTERIIGIGDSAGGTGIGTYACLLTDPALAERFPVTPPNGLHLRALGLNCGLYSMENKRKALRDFLPKGREEETLQLLHIPAHITENFPPCFLMTAVQDFLRDQPGEIIPLLEKHGIRYEYRLYGDEQHPLGHVFHCNMKDQNAHAANAEELQFFRTLL